MSGPEAVIFDLDGLLLESEQLWSEAKRRLVDKRGGAWQERAVTDMLGMSSPEWARYMRDELGVPLEPDAISAEVVRIMGELYREELPLLPGADRAVRRCAERWPLGLASSSNREIIDLALATAGWDELFGTTVSSEEVERGKPAPDVYLEAARRLRAPPERCVAVEDSGPGISSAHAAGLSVVAVPNAQFPPDPGALRAARVVLDSLDDLEAVVIESTSEGRHVG